MAKGNDVRQPLAAGLPGSLVLLAGCILCALTLGIGRPPYRQDTTATFVVKFPEQSSTSLILIYVAIATVGQKIDTRNT